jgi:hypothetical protein
VRAIVGHAIVGYRGLLMSDAPRSPAATRSAAAAGTPTPAPTSTPTPPPEEFEFSEADKEGLAALAASMSFVGVCVLLLGLMSGTFGVGAAYGGFVAIGIGLAAGAAVCLPLGWWATSAGRSLSALVRTRGRDVKHLMEAVAQLRRLFGFARVFIIVYALAAAVAGAAVVWCNFAVEKGGKCFAGWG